MKKLINIVLVLISTVSYAQQSIKPVHIDISDTHWVFLNFHSEIKYGDFGSENIIASITEANNILKIKSSTPFFETTNITIATADGNYYSLELSYAENPSYLAINMKGIKDTAKQSDKIKEYNLYLTDLKTSHIIFDSKIIDISTGVDEVIAEKADNIENIIKSKATDTLNMPTSLTIITEDKSIYPFRVLYDKTPEILSLKVSSDTSSSRVPVLFNQSTFNEEEMRQFGKQIIKKGNRISNIGHRGHKMTFILSSLYIKDDILVFTLKLDNSSDIDYEVDFIKAYVKDKKTSKKTARQEDELYPILTIYSDDKTTIRRKENSIIQMFFNRFTLPKDRIVYFEIFEKNGGRNLKFTITAEELIRAEYIK